MKVIFLDMDGVLNSMRSDLGLDKYVNGVKQYGLDPASVGILKRLCMISNAVIVISSTWRRGKLPGWFIEMFKFYGWDNAPVIDVTPRVSDGYRGEEVKMWLDDHHDVSSYVILDDGTDFYEDQSFVKCSPLNGFGVDEYLQCLQILAPDHHLTIDFTAEISFYTARPIGRTPRTSCLDN